VERGGRLKFVEPMRVRAGEDDHRNVRERRHRRSPGHTTQAIADGGINLAFLVTQVIGKKCAAVFGFDSDDDRRKAIGLVKKARPAKN
jgi:hypothetical protein